MVYSSLASMSKYGGREHRKIEAKMKGCYNVRTIQLSTSINRLIESLLTRHKYPSKLSLFSNKGSKLHETIYDKLNGGRENLRKLTSKWRKARWVDEFDNMDGTMQPTDDWLDSTILLHL